MTAAFNAIIMVLNVHVLKMSLAVAVKYYPAVFHQILLRTISHTTHAVNSLMLMATKNGLKNWCVKVMLEIY